MEVSAKTVVTHGSYWEGVVLTANILGCEAVFLSSVAKYCVWVKNSSNDALEYIVLAWHVQISNFICTLYTKHVSTVCKEHHCNAGHCFASFELVFPFKCVLGNANVEQEFWRLYMQVTHGGEMSDDHCL